MNAKVMSRREVNHDSASLRTLVQRILDEAAKRGASAAEAGVSVDEGFSVNVRMGEVETVEHTRDKGLGVTVYVGQRKGSASTTDFSNRAIAETVQAACDIARYTEADEYAGLPPVERLAKTIPELDLFHPWSIETDTAIEWAQQCEHAARDADARITNSEGAYVSTHTSLRVQGNSQGFLADYPSTQHGLGCTVIAQHGEQMERDYWYSVSRAAADLQDKHSIGRQAAQRAVQRLQARHIKTQQVPVIFVAEVARGLLGHLVRAVSGGALYRKASFLQDSLGHALFPASVTIDERPHLLRALGSAPFDSEGVATQAHDLVKDGVLCSYVLDSYAGRRLGMPTTGNAGGVHNLYINDSGLDLNGLIKTMHCGVVVTEVMGQGVNTVTGDYSRGAAGFWVDKGTIQYPIHEFTLAGNLKTMYAQLQAVGNDIDQRGSLCSGSWLIENMTVAGQ